MRGFRAMVLLGFAVTMQAQSTLPDAPQAHAEAPKVYEVGGDVKTPKLVYMVVPEFTEEARKTRLRGKTEIGLIVDAKGIPEKVWVSRSLAESVAPKYGAIAAGIDQEALRVVKQYRYKPGTLKGKPVAVLIHQEVNFELF